MMQDKAMRNENRNSYVVVLFWMTLSDRAKYSITRSIARPLWDGLRVLTTTSDHIDLRRSESAQRRLLQFMCAASRTAVSGMRLQQLHAATVGETESGAACRQCSIARRRSHVASIRCPARPAAQSASAGRSGDARVASAACGRIFWWSRWTATAHPTRRHSRINISFNYTVRTGHCCKCCVPYALVGRNHHRNTRSLWP